MPFTKEIEQGLRVNGLKLNEKDELTQKNKG
jgi:hypothetical protein